MKQNNLLTKIALEEKCELIYFVNFEVSFIENNDEEFDDRIFCTKCNSNSNIVIIKFIKINHIKEHKFKYGFGYKFNQTINTKSDFGKQITDFIRNKYNLKFYKCYDCDLYRILTPKDVLSIKINRYGI